MWIRILLGVLAWGLLAVGARPAHPAASVAPVNSVVSVNSVAPVNTDGKLSPPKSKPHDKRPKRNIELFTGEVVMLRDALKRRGIVAFDEFEKQVVLETPGGELIPIVPDWRGRAFYQDKRLRDRKVELVGRQRKGIPYLQVLTIFTFDKQGVRQYTDYWCDLCSIPMYEIKPCDCCQDQIRIRFQPRELPDYLSNQKTTNE